jgi:hypothetical protein
VGTVTGLSTWNATGVSEPMPEHPKRATLAMVLFTQAGKNQNQSFHGELAHGAFALI